MKRRLITYAISTVLLIMLSACKPIVNTFEDETPMAQVVNPEVSTENIDCMFEAISPAEVIREIVVMYGENPKSANFSLDTETTIRIFWNQESKENFSLSMVNLDPKLLDNPEKKITFESIVGPSSGCSDTLLNAGEYQVNVEDSVGSWAIVIQEISYKK